MYGGPSPGPSPEGRGVICEVTPIGLLAWVFMCFFSHAGEVFLLRWGVLSLTLGRFFSHREHGGHGGFKRTVSSTQKASGIQSSQSVTAKKGCWVIVVMC